MLTFDEKTHTYRFGGVVVPSVTQVLSDLQDFSHVSGATMAAAQLRGTEAHLMCEWLDQDRLDEEQFDPEVRAYLPGYQRFLADNHPNWSAIEERVYHPIHKYAGCLDRLGVLEAKGADAWLIDLKTSASEHPCWGLQTAAYAHAKGQPNARRATLQLRPDGSYRLREWTDPGDFAIFLSLLNVTRWMNRHGL